MVQKRHVIKKIATAVRVGYGVYKRGKAWANNVRAAYKVAKRVTTKRKANSVPEQAKRRKQESVVMETGEVSTMKKQLGRPMRHTLRNAWKELNAALKPVYYRYQGLTSYENPLGFYSLGRYISGTVGVTGSKQSCPLALFDLTQVFKNHQAPSFPCGYQLNQTWTGATNTLGYIFTSMAGQDQDGLVSSIGYWLPENDGRYVTNPGRRDILKWTDIRMICVGAAQLPTRYEISIVQLSEDYLHPDIPQESMTAQQLGNRNAFWESQVYPYMSNPINIQGVLKARKNIRVLHRVNFTIQAKTTIETQAEAHHKIVKIFKHFNRSQIYDWANNDLNAGTASTGVAVTGYQQDIADVSANVRYKARIYLMVKATNQYPSSSSNIAFDGNKCPTFDLVMRKQHLCTI